MLPCRGVPSVPGAAERHTVPAAGRSRESGPVIGSPPPHDVPGTAPHPGHGRLDGCCGLDGQDGPHLICAGCGADVATKESDCRTQHLVASAAAAVLRAPKVSARCMLGFAGESCSPCSLAVICRPTPRGAVRVRTPGPGVSCARPCDPSSRAGRVRRRSAAAVCVRLSTRAAGTAESAGTARQRNPMRHGSLPPCGARSRSPDPRGGQVHPPKGPDGLPGCDT